MELLNPALLPVPFGKMYQHRRFELPTLRIIQLLTSPHFIKDGLYLPAREFFDIDLFQTMIGNCTAHRSKKIMPVLQRKKIVVKIRNGDISSLFQLLDIA